MAEEERPQKRGSGFFRLFERGVDTATRNKVTAYGLGQHHRRIRYPPNLPHRYRGL